MDRLFASKHVTDLQLIAASSFSAVTVALVIFGTAIFEKSPQSWTASARDLLTSFGPVLAVFGAVLAWVYQAGSARLGVVDLFACEIDTLCRVTLVLDVVRRNIETFDPGSPAMTAGAPRPPLQRFTSQEDYFPVFANNTKDLEALEACVVIKITAFYTYMKTVRDLQRAMAALPQTSDRACSGGGEAAGTTEAGRNLVYMLFLGLESGRCAIGDLVEYEPDRAERSIVILISELEAYRFLRRQFTDETNIFYQRLALRLDDYKRDVPALMSLVRDGAADKLGPRFPPPCKWEPADKLVPELDRVFKAATGPIDPKTHAAGA